MEIYFTCNYPLHFSATRNNKYLSLSRYIGCRMLLLFLKTWSFCKIICQQRMHFLQYYTAFCWFWLGLMSVVFLLILIRFLLLNRVRDKLPPPFQGLPGWDEFFAQLQRESWSSEMPTSVLRELANSIGQSASARNAGTYTTCNFTWTSSLTQP